jgi:hypothetical protein
VSWARRFLYETDHRHCEGTRKQESRDTPFRKFSSRLSFCVASMALCDIPATCVMTCRKSFCVAGAILLRRFQKMSCSFRGSSAPHFTLDTLHLTIHTPHTTFHALHTTLPTPHFTLYTLHSALCTPPSSAFLSLQRTGTVTGETCRVFK